MRIRSSVLSLCLFLSTATLFAQTRPKGDQLAGRPKLVVGIVVDQMRWDYLYRFQNRYSEGGFKRLLREGFSCQNTFINYLPSATAVGHATIFTGSVPSVHGIAANEWIDQLSGKSTYCTEDANVKGIGNSTKGGQMSPRNLQASTITDELRLASNFRSKIVGVSIKDRAAILPAGHNPTGAFWFDDSGEFVTSSWYMTELPQWVKDFNGGKVAEKLVADDWHTLYPINTYTQSSDDNVSWEGMFGGEKTTVFPHKIAEGFKRKPGIIRGTPFGNTLTLSFAKAAVAGYQLGQGTFTDFLTINCASTDYAGHMFGGNSIEVEDIYLRLDRDFADLFSYLDKQVGKGNYLVFLTADHGSAHAKGFMEAHQMNTGHWDTGLVNGLNAMLLKKTNVDGLVRADGAIGACYQVNYDMKKVEGKNLDFPLIKQLSVDYLRKQPGILYAADMDRINDYSIPDWIRMAMINGYNYKRSGPVQIVPESGWMPEYSKTGTTHGGWNPYDSHIPLIFMGKGIKRGTTNRHVNMVDIAPTLAALLHVQMPSGSVGTVITEVTTKK
jgi:predicted AlkP superfamily pyrophosphatase or phosphodiesterase